MKRLIAMFMTILIVPIFCINTRAEELEEIPEEVQEICHEVGQEFNVCPTILLSLIYTESRGIVTDNLTQITNTKWFKEGMDACEVDEIKTPENNIRVCAYYIAKWCEESEDIFLAVDSWRYGPENAAQRKKPSYYARTIVDRSARWEEEFYRKHKREV